MGEKGGGGIKFDLSKQSQPFCPRLKVKLQASIYVSLPWIPEPSTVNNKLKRREGSGSTGRFFD
jgi:hypothetical protein